MGIKKYIKGAVITSKKHAPEIELVAGLILIGASLYFTRKAAVKEVEILKDHNARVQKVKETAPVVMDVDEDESVDAKTEVNPTELAQAYAETGVNLFKAYAPAIGTFIAGTGLVVFSHRTLKKREIAAVLTSECLRKAFSSYRARVKDAVGEKAERQLYYGTKTDKVVVVSDDEKVVEVIPEAEIVQDICRSPFSVVIDNTCGVWDPSPTRLENDLQFRVSCWNSRKNVDGSVMLYDVIKDLGALHKVPKELHPMLMREAWYKPDSMISFDLMHAFADVNLHMAQVDANYRYFPVIDFNTDGDIFRAGINPFSIRRA